MRKITQSKSVTLVAHDVGVIGGYSTAATNQKYIKNVVFLDSIPPAEIVWQIPGYTQEGPGHSWHFCFFSFEDVAKKLISSDPKFFMSRFILS